jgi:hypothetical protein
MGAFKLVVQQRKQNDVHTPHPNGPQWIFDNNGKRVRGYKGLRFCIFMNRSERCGEVLIDEWKRRKYDTRVCKKCVECAQELKVSVAQAVAGKCAVLRYRQACGRIR